MDNVNRGRKRLKELGGESMGRKKSVLILKWSGIAWRSIGVGGRNPGVDVRRTDK